MAFTCFIVISFIVDGSTYVKQSSCTYVLHELYSGTLSSFCPLPRFIHEVPESAILCVELRFVVDLLACQHVFFMNFARVQHISTSERSFFFVLQYGISHGGNVTCHSSNGNGNTSTYRANSGSSSSFFLPPARFSAGRSRPKPPASSTSVSCEV